MIKHHVGISDNGWTMSEGHYLKNEHGERLYKYRINGVECYMTISAGTSLSYNHTLMVHCLE